MFQLYYYPNNASLAPHFLLHHLQAPYELVLVDRKANAHKSDDYLRLNPMGRIPALVDGELTLFESAAICVHLCERYPQSGLLPPVGSHERAHVFQWLMFLTNTLQSQLMARYYPSRQTDDVEGVTSVIAAQDRRIEESLAILDAQLATSAYLVDAQLTACDYYLFMLACWCLPLERSPARYPHLSRYIRLLCDDLSIKAVCALEGIDLSRFTLVGI
uniref:glutathione S-transferase family protein n=1 Tax=Thaumasiovibrio occultus TaxID=1891184 RepID=UPI000B34CB4F|nr:glutathione S-transferase family protein [Thaumasiovibrio occultus]